MSFDIFDTFLFVYRLDQYITTLKWKILTVEYSFIICINSVIIINFKKQQI